MTITTPESHILPPYNGEKNHVIDCARICYESTPSDVDRMYERLIKRGHLSMLRHASFYYRVPTTKLAAYYHHTFRTNPYCGIVKGNDKHFYIVLNGQYVHENEELIAKSGINEYRTSSESFCQCRETALLCRLTFVVRTQIAITRELNRVSPNNIAERSTRYVDFLRKLGIRFSRPHWFNGLGFFRRSLARFLMRLASVSYRIARSKYGLNLKAEDARYFLPLGTETKVAYTYSIAEWLSIIEKRFHDSTGKAHPDCKTVIEPIHEHIHNFLSIYDAK